jgi:hypothetical protein
VGNAVEQRGELLEPMDAAGSVAKMDIGEDAGEFGGHAAGSGR